MSDKPAVIDGCYVDAKFMRGLKVMRISVDIPIEHSNEFIRMFGAPDGADPVPVAIARLEPSVVEAGRTGALSASTPDKPVSAAPVERAETKRSSRAYLMCRDREFQEWVHGLIIAPRVPGEPVAYFDQEPAEWTNQALKSHLGITSKQELDTNPEAAARFDALRTDFEMRDLVR